MVKPENALPVLKDKYVMSSVVTFANASGTLNPFFIDWDNVWQVIDISVLVTTAYVAAQAATLSAGYVGAPTQFANAVTLGTAAVAVGGRIIVVQPPLSTATGVQLPKGSALIASWVQNASQTGAGIVVIRLRPRWTKYQSAKKPGGAAMSAS